MPTANDVIRKPRQGERGMLAVLWAVSLSSVILLLILSYAPFLYQSRRVVDVSARQAQAIASAEAGVEDALWELSGKAPYDRILVAGQLFGAVTTPAQTYVDLDLNNTVNSTDLMLSGQSWFGNKVGWVSSTGTALCTPFCFTRTATVVTGGTYSVTVQGISNTPVPFPPFCTDAPYYRCPEGPGSRPQPRIVSTGTVNGGVAPARVTVLLEQQHPDFRYAAFGDAYLHVLGKIAIDSYDSRGGAYGGANISEHGDVGTNVSRPGVVNPNKLYVSSLEAQLKGIAYLTTGLPDVSYPDPIGWPLLGRPPTDTTVQATQRLPPVVLPSPPPLVFGDVVLAFGATDSCSEARYYHRLEVMLNSEFVIHQGCKLYFDQQGTGVSSLFAVNDNGKVTVAADVTTPVTVFVKDGAFLVQGEGVTRAAGANLTPELFQAYVTGAGTSNKLAQRQPFYGVIYVQDPDGATTTAGELSLLRGQVSTTSGTTYYNASYYGSFIAGDRLIIGDGTSESIAIHYDEALKGLPLDGRGRAAAAAVPRYRIRSWSVQ